MLVLIIGVGQYVAVRKRADDGRVGGAEPSRIVQLCLCLGGNWSACSNSGYDRMALASLANARLPVVPFPSVAVPFPSVAHRPIKRPDPDHVNVEAAVSRIVQRERVQHERKHTVNHVNKLFTSPKCS